VWPRLRRQVILTISRRKRPPAAGGALLEVPRDREKRRSASRFGPGLRKGGDSGPVVVPGKPDESRLIQAVRRTGELKMPPDTRLSDQQIPLW